MKEALTVCPRNCYSTCTFRVQVKENRIFRILPDEANRVVPEGPCIKGLSYIERASSSERLTEPLRRQPDGSFRQIPYESAIEEIVSRLSVIHRSELQKSVLYYTGSGMSGLTNEIGSNFFRLFGGATTTYGNFCWPAGLEAVRLTLGDIRQNVPWELENSDLIIIWGKNPAETNIQETVFIDRARQKGARIIVIDPRRTPTADKADILIRPKPGSDGAIAVAVAGIIARSGRSDKEFIERYVKGYDEFAESLNISPEEAASLSGVTVDEIYTLADAISGAGAVTIIAGFGMQRYTNGGQTVRSILALLIMTGNIGRPGAGFNYATTQGYIFDRVREPLSYYPEIGASPLFRRSISIARLGEDLLKTENPSIQFAWIERGNPVTQAPDTAVVRKALARIGFKVVVDQFMTDTARCADIVLPAKNMFEQQDIVSSYWSPYISFRPALLTAPGSVKPESELFYDIATGLGLKFTPDDIPQPGIQNTDRWLEKRIAGYSELTLEVLKKGSVIVPGLREVAYDDLQFPTPSGLIELSSETAAGRWKVPELPGFMPAFGSEERGADTFIFLSPNTKNRIHSQFGNLEAIRIHDREPLLQINGKDASRLGIVDGMRVKVANSRGSLILKARVTSTIRSGVVALPNGWWITEGGNGNFLSKGRETDMGHGTAFHDNIVRISPAGNE